MQEKVRLIDVGARGGIDPRWKSYYEMLEVVAFEPDPQECAALNSKQYPYAIRFLPTALGAQDGQKSTLYLCKQPGCSSLLRPNMELSRLYPYGESMEVVREISITLNRMDSVCKDFKPDILKIDTQGTELDVLKGAGALLESVIAVELEVEFVPQYLEQPLFSDIDIFMRQQGFTLRGLRRTYWRMKADHVHPYGGQIIHGDALYIRTNQIDCNKGHVILAAYRQYDLLAYLGATHLIPKLSLSRRIASRLFSRYEHWQLRRIVDSLRPASATDWHDPEFF